MKTIFEKTSIGRLLKYLDGDALGVGSYAYPADVESDSVGHFIQIHIFQTETVENPLKTRGNAQITNRSARDVLNTQANTVVNRRDEPGATGAVGRARYGSANRTTKISDIVTLYMPEKITTSYSTEYEGFEMGAGALFGNVGSAVDAFNNFDKSSLSDVGARIGDAYKTLSNNNTSSALTKREINDLVRMGAANLNPSIEAALNANLRNLRNPHMEFLFKGVNQREFRFDFMFTPKSPDEANRVRDIIKLLKYHQLPRARDGATGVFYDYPSEFVVTLMSNGKENPFLHKISSCALVGLDVDYTAAGTSSFHRETTTSDGEIGSSPTHTSLSLTFRELEIMSQNRIEEGY